MDVTFVKGPPDRVYLGGDGDDRRVAVHVSHDLPHLVVESYFGITDGLWGELAAGLHSDNNAAAAARDPKRQKQGHIVAGASLSEWLTESHRIAKAVTNAVTNRWGDGPDTPAGVRARLGAVTVDVDDATITAAFERWRALSAEWTALPPGDALRLSWPLER